MLTSRRIRKWYPAISLTVRLPDFSFLQPGSISWRLHSFPKQQHWLGKKCLNTGVWGTAHIQIMVGRRAGINFWNGSVFPDGIVWQLK